MTFANNRFINTWSVCTFLFCFETYFTILIITNLLLHPVVSNHRFTETFPQHDAVSLSLKSSHKLQHLTVLLSSHQLESRTVSQQAPCPFNKSHWRLQSLTCTVNTPEAPPGNPESAKRASLSVAGGKSCVTARCTCAEEWVRLGYSTSSL